MHQTIISKIFLIKLSSTLKILILLSLVLLIYKDIRQLKFADADDGWMLFSNFLVNSEVMSAKWFIDVFTNVNGGQYSPINTLYYYLIFQIDGYNAYIFHLASILLHLLNVFLIYRLATVIFSLHKFDHISSMSYCVALFWVIHPLNVEPVVWISASKVLLFSTFSLLSILLVVAAIQRRQGSYYLLSLVSFTCACFCKEQAIVLPAIFLIILILPWDANNLKVNKAKFSLLLFFAFVISIAFLVVFINLTISDTVDRKPALAYNLYERINLVLYCLNFYFIDFFTPMNLKLFYPFPFKASQHIPYVIILGNALLFLLIFRITSNILINKPLNRFYLFCTLFFFINIIVVLQIISMSRSSITADRYMYLPSVGLIMIVVKLLFDTLIKNTSKFRIIASAFIMLLASYYTIYSMKLVTGWSNINLKDDIYENSKRLSAETYDKSLEVSWPNK